ncbi:MAG TPA: alpha/beta fold hydrolase [Granulicella sp.]
MDDIFVSVNGVRVHVQRSGDGPPLLLLHGLVGSARNWDPNIGFLSEHATVYAIDLFNMGESDRVAGLDSSLEATADRLVLLLDELGLARADVAGHSHGGALSMMLAARHPERVGKLILFAPANPFCDFGHQLIRFYTSPFGRWFAHQIPIMPRTLKAIALSRMYGDPSRIAKGTLDGYIDGLEVPGTIDHILSIVGQWFDDMASLRAALARLAEKPTLLIWGDRDRTVGLNSARRLQEILTKSKLCIIPGVGHIPFAEMPEQCNQAMGEWLRRPRPTTTLTTKQQAA